MRLAAHWIYYYTPYSGLEIPGNLYYGLCARRVLLLAAAPDWVCRCVQAHDWQTRGLISSFRAGGGGLIESNFQSWCFAETGLWRKASTVLLWAPCLIPNPGLVVLRALPHGARPFLCVGRVLYNVNETVAVMVSAHCDAARVPMKPATALQSANAAAPQLIDALITLGRAQEDHVAFAVLGLAQPMRQNALDAAKSLQKIAARLVSRRIATDVRIEISMLRASSSAPMHLIPVDWTSPHAIPVGEGDILPLLIHHHERQPDWPVRSVCHYRIAAKLAQLNTAWAKAVASWHAQECCFSLLGGQDADEGYVESTDLRHLTNFVRLSGPHALALHLHGNEDTHPLRIPTDSFAVLAARCPRLQRLCIRFSDTLTVPCLLDILAACPALLELDLVTSYVDPMSLEALFSMITSRPHLRLYVASCDLICEAAENIKAGVSWSSVSWGDAAAQQLCSQLVHVSCSAANCSQRSRRCAKCMPGPAAIPYRYGWPAWSPFCLATQTRNASGLCTPSL